LHIDPSLFVREEIETFLFHPNWIEPATRTQYVHSLKQAGTAIEAVNV